MKNTTKLKIIGCSLLTLSVILMLLGATVFRDRSWDDFAWKPNFALFVPGMFLGVISLGFLITGFTPELAKFQAKVQAETVDHAGKEIKVATAKTAETIIPAITPSLKTAVSDINSGIKASSVKSRKEQLLEAKQLFDDRLISEEEYQAMRKDILDIEEN